MCSTDYVPYGWGGKDILSIYIPSGYSVNLYQNVGEYGPNLGLYTPGSYNNVLTSGVNVVNVNVYSNQTQPHTQTQTSSQTCPTFYRNENQQGDIFQMCSSGDVPSEWNDQALSFYVPSGYSIQLY